MSTNHSELRLGIHELAGRPGTSEHHEFTVGAPERWGEGIVAVTADSPVELDVLLESVHEGILARGGASATASGECSRCLTALDLPVEVDFQELFAYSSDEAFDFEVQDDQVDLEPLVRDAIVLSLPFQPVCRPDCPGLDETTGELRSESPVAEKTPIDPRWAALEQFKASEQ